MSGIILIMSFVLFWTLTSCCSGYSYDNFSNWLIYLPPLCVVLGLEYVWMYNGWGADLTLGSCPTFQGVKGQSGPRGCHSHTGVLFLGWFLLHCFFWTGCCQCADLYIWMHHRKNEQFPNIVTAKCFFYFTRNNLMPTIAADLLYNEFYNEYNELMLQEQKCLP